MWIWVRDKCARWHFFLTPHTRRECANCRLCVSTNLSVTSLFSRWHYFIQCTTAMRMSERMRGPIRTYKRCLTYHYLICSPSTCTPRIAPISRKCLSRSSAWRIWCSLRVCAGICLSVKVVFQWRLKCTRKQNSLMAEEVLSGGAFGRRLSRACRVMILPVKLCRTPETWKSKQTTVKHEYTM